MKNRARYRVTYETPPAATVAAATLATSLHVCPSCSGRFVHPLDWADAGNERWKLHLRCPDCGECREGVFGRGAVERLDEELDRASSSMLDDYKRLMQANMTEEVELFVRALKLDLIGPSDFQQ